MPSSIVCPVDFSEPARSALRYAKVIANRLGAPLLVVAVDDLQNPVVERRLHLSGVHALLEWDRAVEAAVFALAAVGGLFLLFRLEFPLPGEITGGASIMPVFVSMALTTCRRAVRSLLSWPWSIPRPLRNLPATVEWANYLMPSTRPQRSARVVGADRSRGPNPRAAARFALHAWSCPAAARVPTGSTQSRGCAGAQGMPRHGIRSVPPSLDIRRTTE
jgi:hypothetical protein